MRIGADLAGVSALAAVAAWPAWAAQTIGGAVQVQREVSGQVEGRSRALAAGDAVHQDETIRTGAGSSAELGFLDRTRLAVGATATVKLDRFVYDPDRGARSVVLTATKGVARFVTGAGPSQAYQVRTPHATIGVRGTVFDVMVMAGRTVVVLIEGAVRVCARGGRRPCEELRGPGDVAIVSTSSVQGPSSAAAQGLDVAALNSALGGGTITLVSTAPQAPTRDIGDFGAGRDNQGAGGGGGGGNAGGPGGGGGNNR
jgi:hypothetical protein